MAIIFVIAFIGALIEDEGGIAIVLLLIALFVVLSIPEKNMQQPKSTMIEKIITDSTITTTEIIKYKDSTITTKTIEKRKKNEKNN